MATADAAPEPRAWRALCAALFEQAAAGCGLSDVLCSRRYSRDVDLALAQLRPSQRQAALVVARELGMYQTADELAIEMEGTCSHGLEPHACSAGCSDKFS